MKMKYFGLLAAAFIIAGCGNAKDENLIEASGTIEAVNVIVSSKTNGDAQKIFFDEGDYVMEGDTLMIIEHKKLLLQLEQLEAAKEQARARYDMVMEGARDEDIVLAEDMLEQAQVNYDLAKKDFDRIEQLYESETVPGKRYDDAKARLELAELQLNSAKKNLEKIKNISRPEEVRQAAANLRRARASVDLVKEQISDAYVTAPVDGYIVTKYIEPGETAAPMASLLKISNLDPVELIVFISETDLGRIKYGQSVEVSSDTYEDKTYKGKVSYISSEAEFTPKNIQTEEERTKLVYEVKVKVDNPDHELKSGMPADALIKIK